MKFDFDDINLVPKKCVVNSRSECDTSVILGNYKFKLPIVPANMECVIDIKLAETLAKEDYFYILHRFLTDEQIIDFVKSMNSQDLVTSISIGVNEDSYNLIDKIVNSNLSVDFITIDIAHGHSIKMQKMLQHLKVVLPYTFLIAGNISSNEAALEMESWGAHALKVGIGPGCFVPDAMIECIGGLKQLKEVKKGDFVLTHTNSYKKVLEVHSYNSEHEMIKINELPACTSKHKFFVVNKKDSTLINDSNYLEYGCWVSANELDKNKHLLIKLG